MSKAPAIPLARGGAGGTHGRRERDSRVTAWNGLCAALGTVMGLLPHVLHHATLIAGAALVTGLVGNLVFGLVGLVLSAPLHRRLCRRFGTWKAPALALAVFVTMFSVSASSSAPPSLRAEAIHRLAIPTSVDDHSAHHTG